MAGQYTESNFGSHSSQTVHDNILFAFYFIDSVFDLGKRNQKSALEDSCGSPFRFRSDINVNSFLEIWQSFKVYGLRLDELVLELFNVEFIVPFDIEVPYSEETVDNIHFFALFSQNNELFFIGNKVWHDVDNRSNIRQP